MAFCCTAAAVRPSFLATWPVGVPDFASALSVANSRALQDAPSFGGRRAISFTPQNTQRRAGRGIIHHNESGASADGACDWLHVGSAPSWRQRRKPTWPCQRADVAPALRAT